MPTKREKQGTIHDLESQLSEIQAADEHHPHTKKQIARYRKIFNDLGLFPKGADLKKKNEIISKIRIENFDEDEIIEQQRQIKALESYNRLIDKEKRRLQDEAASGKNMIKNEKILSGKEKIEINIPDKIRSELKIFDKEVKLSRYTLEPQKNKLKYSSGQDYNFIIRNGFGRALVVSYSKLQKIRKEGNVVKYVLDKFKEDVEATYQRDKLKFEKSKDRDERRKWKHKKKVYGKIIDEVLEHNIQISTNKSYNKPFVKKDKKGNISDKDSRIPVMMKITKEDITLFIP